MKSIHLLLILGCLSISEISFAQCDMTDCTYTETDITAASISGAFTVSVGETLCITSDYCMGATAIWPFACPNAGVANMTINGNMRLCENVKFGFQGNISGSGVIQILDGANFSHNGTLDCGSGMELHAVDPDYATNPTSKVINAACQSAACNPVIDETSNSYNPYKIVTAGLGFTIGGVSGCPFKGFETQAAILPVELYSFEVSIVRGKSELKWSTASEENNDFFEIQRSFDALDFETIGWVEGQGTTTEITGYTFVDEAPLNGKNYYRLKQVDVDYTKFSFSQIEVLEFQERGKKDYLIFPTNFQDQIYVINKNTTSRKCTILNMNQQIINSFILEPGYNNLDLSHLENGIYLISISQMKNGINKNERVEKLIRISGY